MDPRDPRPSQNLVIDRGIQAGIVVQTWDQYAAVPHNRADLQDYDTKGAGKPVTGEVPETPVGKAAGIGSAVPGKPYASADRVLAEAQEFNSRRPYDELRDDLRSSKNVRAITQANVDAWKEDPNKMDLKNIDTRPRSITWNTAEWARKTYTDTPAPSFTLRSPRTGGRFNRSINRFTGEVVATKISMNPNDLRSKGFDVETNYAHEVGHAFHYKNLGDGAGGFGDVPEKELKITSNMKSPILPPTNARQRAYKKYRESKAELFADSFAGLIYDRKRFAPKMPQTMAMIEKKHPGFQVGLKEAEEQGIKTHIGMIKKGKYPKGFKKGKYLI